MNKIIASLLTVLLLSACQIATEDNLDKSKKSTNTPNEIVKSQCSSQDCIYKNEEARFEFSYPLSTLYSKTNTVFLKEEGNKVKICVKGNTETAEDFCHVLEYFKKGEEEVKKAIENFTLENEAKKCFASEDDSLTENWFGSENDNLKIYEVGENPGGLDGKMDKCYSIAVFFVNTDNPRLIFKTTIAMDIGILISEVLKSIKVFD